jgi:septum formation protein
VLQSLVLASTSPRRKELLEQIGVVFTQLSININEDVAEGENPEQYVLRLAQEKAVAGFNLLSVIEKDNCVVLAADTTVVCNGQILAKPESLSHSKEILAQLSGCEHVVMSAIGLYSKDKTVQKVVTTKVRFRNISAAEIEAYWHSGEPQDKAGSYGIQGLGAVFVGLPLCETAQLLNQFNIAFWQL